MTGVGSDAEREKTRLRREIRAALRRMPDAERRRAGATARERIVDLVDRSQARTVLAYLSDGLEVDLDPTIELLLDRGCTVAVPVVLEARGRMVPARITSLDPSAFARDRYDLRSPHLPLSLVDPATLDLILVPGVAFTTAGHRLGRGGGYYDRLLADLPGRVRRVGVCHAGQVVTSVPVEPHDAGVDDLVSV